MGLDDEVSWGLCQRETSSYSVSTTMGAGTPPQSTVTLLLLIPLLLLVGKVVASQSTSELASPHAVSSTVYQRYDPPRQPGILPPENTTFPDVYHHPVDKTERMCIKSTGLDLARLLQNGEPGGIDL